LGFVALPQTARACGGLFCNAPPANPFSPLPVAQTGENIVFSIDKDPAGGATKLTAEIQISYAGDAAQFSWVVPVDAAPTLSVGTDQLFTALATLTQPTFVPTYAVSGQCLPDSFPGFNGGPTDARGGMAAGTGGATGSVGTAAPTVTVISQEVVGPYDSAVITANDPTALKKWLVDAGYTVSDQAGTLIDAYVREGKFFVALKLANGQNVKSIQPIVLNFIATEPCVPLRLTAIAANPEMQVRLWVFGDRRAVPRRFFELKIDEARIDWLSRGSNYNALVSQAANEAPGGDAFVTEYAVAASIAQGLLWSPGRYDLTALQMAMTPPVYVQALIPLGLAGDPQMLPLLVKYIPMPPAVKALGITDAQFYGNLSQYWSQYTFPPFDLAGLTTQISAKIIEPRHAAQTMMDAHSYLTRLNTFISPEEMTDDPLFITNGDLGNVPLAHTATFRTMCGNQQFMACNAPIRLELADGRMAWVRTGSTSTSCAYVPYDLSKLQTLPASEVVWQREEVGEGTRIVDNVDKIQAGLMLNNSAFAAAQNMFPIPIGAGGVPTTQSAGDGCACNVGGAPSGTFGMTSVVGVLALLLVRRRRPRHRRP